MASPGSPTSPAAASRDATPELLTPRSKIRALLATVDSDDDETGPSKSTTFATMASIRARRSPGLAAEDGSDSGSDVPVRPRGKLASRMQGAAAARVEKRTIADERAEADGDNTQDVQNGAVDGHRKDGQDGDDGQGEDGDLPVAHRRLQQRIARSPSPDLFVSSPARSAASPSKDLSDDRGSGEDEIPATKADRFKALVERKRQERLQREAEEEARRAKRQEEFERLADLDDDDEDEDEEGDDGFTGTAEQQARPVRRAGKKAIEEMNRETQRMARNMQLAHEAKTRKKVTKASLFERFNYKPAGALLPAEAPVASSRQASPKSSAGREGDTPPSSPPAEKQDAGPSDSAEALMDPEAGQDVPMGDPDDDDDLPPLEEIQISAPRTIDKGKGKMPAFDPAEPLDPPPQQQKRRVRVRLPVPSSRPAQALDSDDELQITTTAKDKMNAVFDSVPLIKSQENQSMLALRALALVRSPGKEARRSKDQTGMTPGELQTYLQQKARQQAKVERDRRLELLKAQGISVQSAEEREREMQEVEDILAKAREEGERIGQEEKAAAKKEREERGEMDPLAWDSSDADEEYEDNGDDDEGEGSAIELSGSEDEEEDESMDVDVDHEDSEAALIDAAAEVDDAEELPTRKRTRARNPVAVLSDDEDGAEMSIKATPGAKTPKRMGPTIPASDPIAPESALRSAKKTVIPGLPVQGAAELGLTQIFAGTMDGDSPMNEGSGPDPLRFAPEAKTPAKTPQKTTSIIPNSDPIAPTSVLRSAKKTFIPGLPVQGPAGLGLTQIFAGTMDGSPASPSAGPTPSIMPDFTQIPSPNLSPTRTNDDDDAMDEEMVMDSQMELEQARADVPSQFSSTIEPTQDGGLQTQTPLLERFVDLPSTIDAAANDARGATIPESPLILKGRLRRKMDLSPRQQEDGSQDKIPLSSEPNVFSGMKKSARKQKLQEEFDKKKSKAKEMVEEQAEESEDEYAGLGGADGELSDDDDSAASVHEFLDDAAGNDVDERKTAAFFADQEVANDQKQVEKLYKDITSGRLRKRGADYDLSDSDDGGEALRRMKRRQFDKMQKSLFADERVKKIAEDPGNLAFIRSIEDRGSDDEIILADASAGGSQSEEAQSRESSVPAEQRKKGGATSRTTTTTGSRPPAHLRRTKDGKKPSNLGEIRETVSDLLDERFETIIPATAEDGDSDEEEGGGLADSRASRRRSPSPRRSTNTVVDRMKKKPAVSSTSSRLVFATAGAPSSSSSASAGSSSFKVPNLLRRATTNSSLISGPSANKTTLSTSTSSARQDAGGSMGQHSGGFGADAKIKKGAGKKSGVHGFTRDLERNARMKENERRREERKIKGAESRAGLVGGLLGKGTFE